jgi:hypothetical protein
MVGALLLGGLKRADIAPPVRRAVVVRRRELPPHEVGEVVDLGEPVVDDQEPESRASA